MNHYFTPGQNLNQCLIPIHFISAAVMDIQTAGAQEALPWLQGLKGRARCCDLWEPCRVLCRQSFHHMQHFDSWFSSSHAFLTPSAMLTRA